MIERQHLAILLAIANHGTLTAAATSLHLTQPALTHAIKKLEGQVNTPLWIKDGRNLQLTQAGQYLLRLAQRLIPQFEHAEQVMQQISAGQQGALRIGMECHPCYQWLLKIVAPYLHLWPKVDVDVKQQFKFGGIGALFGYEIDILVTPDPLLNKGLHFEPVFNYEQVLVVSNDHPLAKKTFVEAKHLSTEVLITYPIETERLDIFNQFLVPAHCTPAAHKTIETTDILIQMVASNRGVSALPNWLADEYAQHMNITTVKLGKEGIAKSIYLGTRNSEPQPSYLVAFLEMAKAVSDPTTANKKTLHKQG